MIAIAVFYAVAKNPPGGQLADTIRFFLPFIGPGVYIGLFLIVLSGLHFSFWILGGIINVSVYMAVGALIARRQWLLAAFVLSIAITGAFLTGEPGGQDLNQGAWEASFIERDLPVPPRGPREGYWGIRVNNGKKIPDEVTIWREAPVNLENLIVIDRNGLQGAFLPEHNATVLMVGGSVAFGAYASDISSVYFTRMQNELLTKGIRANVFVAAAGGWKSAQEIKALQKFLPLIKPDVVVMLGGLNDLVLGSSAGALANESFGKEVQQIPEIPAERDYAARIALYLQNMREARRLTESSGVPIIFALQPAVFEKEPQSFLEKKISYASLQVYGLPEEFAGSYEEMRKGLRAMSDALAAHFLDLSKIFDGEQETVFSDIYHFSDIGHEILAQKLSAFIAPILESRVVAE